MKILKRTLLLQISSLLLSNIGLCDVPYLSGQIGVFATSFERTNTSSFGVGRISGGYLWDKTKRCKLGIETGFTSFQDTKFNYDHVNVPFLQGRMKRTSLDLLGLMEYYVSKRLELSAKAGAAYVWQDFISDSTGYVFTPSSHNGLTPKLGIGIGYDMLKNINISFAIDQELRKSATNVNSSITPARTAMLGARYKFF